jgi:putative redox protein
VLAAAGRIDEVTAVATIGAPADADPVIKNFHADVGRIEAEGEAEVSLAGRAFTIRKQLLDDLRGQTLLDGIGKLRAAVLVLHSPVDNTVGIDNATRIFLAAKHPKSFVSLDRADHLLSNHEDARYAARVIAAWASRFLPEPAADEAAETSAARVKMTGAGKFETAAEVGPHRLTVDEPVSYGGDGRGPSPFDYLAVGLGACTVMTMRMYADRKGWSDVDFTAEVEHGKVHAADCRDCAEDQAARSGKIDRFERRIAISANATAEQRAKLIEIAGKCPVHRTLTESAAVVTYDVSDA